MKNILQIDLEDWYCDIDPNDWHRQEPRVVGATEKVLSILDDGGSKATFFVLGHVAEQFPDLIKTIAGKGHEIATHGYGHRRITDQTPEEFREDLRRSIAVLKGITDKKITGYRAPQFTVMKETLWALDILREEGMEYDSSIFPVKTPLYGLPDSPLFPYTIGHERIVDGAGLVEIPLSIYRVPLFGKRVPIAGGFYLRFFPYGFISHAIRKLNRAGNVAVCYVHPWEFDPGKPRIDSLRWYHYYRLSSTEPKFRKLTKEFQFISTREWIEDERTI
jgi:polysaccharide deacetylase family protein (PEP-CTERM system associated)